MIILYHKSMPYYGNVMRKSIHNKQLTKQLRRKNWEKHRKKPMIFMDIHGYLWCFMVHCSTFQLKLHLPKVRKEQLTEQGSWWKTRRIAQISVMECLKKWIAPGFFYNRSVRQCQTVYMNIYHHDVYSNIILMMIFNMIYFICTIFVLSTKYIIFLYIRRESWSFSESKNLCRVSPVSSRNRWGHLESFRSVALPGDTWNTEHWLSQLSHGLGAQHVTSPRLPIKSEYQGHFNQDCWWIVDGNLKEKHRSGE